MPAVVEAIDKMTMSEKYDTMNYLWSSLSLSGDSLVPDWHRRELERTEARVAAGMELAYRPHGLEPLLFAKKRLLVLSRMVDPVEPPRRDELLGLNYIAAALAEAGEGGRSVYVTAPQGGRNQVVYQCHPFMGVFNLIATPSRGDNIRFSAFLPVVYGTGKAFSRERKRDGSWIAPLSCTFYGCT